MSKIYWPLWRSVRSQTGVIPYRHVGSLHAADDQMALRMLRDAGGPPQRRLLNLGGEGQGTVACSRKSAATPSTRRESKVYRHPTYTVPRWHGTYVRRR